MEKVLNDKLAGEQLSSVEFVQDYLQLNFDGRIITSYIWPTVEIGEEVYKFGDQNYRNKLCGLIGKKIDNISCQEKKYLMLLFENGIEKIMINLDPNNPEIVSEIAIFNDELDKTWIVFD